MAEQSTIKQISIGEKEYEIDAKYWGGLETSILDDKLDKSEFTEVIDVDANNDEFIIKDNNGYVGLKLDSDGLYVKDVTSVKGGVQHVLSEKINKNYVDEKIFVGTQTEYDIAYANNRIALGALVIILDEELGGASATAKLGVAVLGKMKLGQE
jgi:hypothetical protein